MERSFPVDLDKYKLYWTIDKEEYYNSEERLGRSRKNRKEFETNPNVIDFEMFVLPTAYDKGGERLLKRVYSHYLKKGYDYRGS